MADRDDQTPQAAEPTAASGAPVVPQDPKTRTSGKEPDGVASVRKEKQMSSGTTKLDPQAVSVVEPQASSKLPDRDDTFSRPTGFDERFVVAQRRTGQDLYRSYDDQRPAIEDQGDALRTKNADRATAMDMVELASHRGWSKMNVKGPEEFRRELWIEGTAQGMAVKGYRPSDKDRSEAERRADLVGYRIIERADGKENARGSNGRGIASSATAGTGGNTDKGNVVELPNYDKGVRGTISGMGQAPYMDREGAASTPYVALDLADGRSHKLWGVGLPSMISDSGLTVGDRATIASAGKKAVTIDRLDEKSGDTKQINTYRREWEARDIERSQTKSPEQSRSDPVPKRDEAQTGNPNTEREDSLIETPDCRGSQDRATELEDRLKSSQAGRDPLLKGAASKLSLMEAELKAQGVSPAEVTLAVSNARTQMSQTLADGKKIPVEKLANVTRNQEEKARDIARTERGRTIERDRDGPSDRTPGR